MKIQKIEKVPFDDYVYNLELKTNSSEDDLFWIENKSGIITHNCFPKDINAILHIAQKMNLGLPTITGTSITNMIVRQNKDWEKMEGRAVSTRPELTDDVVEENNKG